MKRVGVALVALSLLLSGCSAVETTQPEETQGEERQREEGQREEKSEYPAYFQPAVMELEAAFEEWEEWDENRNENGIGRRWFNDFFEPAFRDFGLSCVGEAHDGIFRCCKGGACWIFDLSEQYPGVEGEEEYYWWAPRAIYHVEEENRVYISWSASGTPPSEESPQFLLLSFPAGKPWEREAKFFQRPSVAISSFWEPNCCLVGDNFYFMDDNDTVAFNMRTGELIDLYPELDVVRNCADKFKGDTDCSLYSVGFLYEQDGVEVYCAYVSDEMDGYVFVAFQDGEPITGMRADVSGQDLLIELIEVDESGD